ncbi:uncharacterized protein LOC132196930 [Neocloeon triangulifer]|uniref:uncharacterized protein LOC132196930 n=1 Tax=Neocloeon triangulifer TaxID=2078957 RepID=UPI00286EE83F|nr:uncharacterized protein LOC132196930 [Neocloeon triangulifer]XP_059475866.1 uncharacterized protein LOC132196930 [Neocloeon triangulifer]
MSAANTPNAQGVYSPLPYSDSESEEEVFSKAPQLTSRNHELQQHKKTSPLYVRSQATPNGKLSNAESSLMAEYRPLSNSETSLNGFSDKGRVVLIASSPNENAKFENPFPNSKAINQNGWESMSYARKICFLSSIFLCIFTIVGFLWILPCDLESNCSASSEFKGDHSQLTTPGSWESVLQGIELTGPPTFTQGRLIFTVRGPQPAVRSLTSGEPRWHQLGYGPYRPDRRSGGQAGGGALALLPTTGTLLWTIIIPGAAPTAANCELLDMNNNGKRDCLLANSDWILAAIDPINGKFLWTLDAQRENSSSRNSSDRLMKPQQLKPAKIVFPPLVVQDLDDDDVSDLLALGSLVTGRSADCFVLISGKTGTLIGKLVNVSGCVSISKLELSEEGSMESVLFDCMYTVGGVSVRKMDIGEIYLRAINKSKQDLASAPPLQKRQQPYRDPSDQNTNNGHSYILEAEGHFLSIENIGTCPKCKSVLTLTDAQNNTVWGYTGKGERAMSPVSLHFSGASSLSNSGNSAHKNGFVFKLWVWPPSAPKSSKASRKPKDEEPYHKLLKRSDNNYIIDHGGVEEGSPSLKNDVEVLELKERVVLITFSSSDLHVVNASQSNIAVLCATNKQRYRSSFEPVCQPELAAQQKSLLVADLDEDGTQELVSFTSTYIPITEPATMSSTNHPNRISAPISPAMTSWELISKIKVIHLETELSKLK